jgi:hypothetical protein
MDLNGSKSFNTFVFPRAPAEFHSTLKEISKTLENFFKGCRKREVRIAYWRALKFQAEMSEAIF